MRKNRDNKSMDGAERIWLLGNLPAVAINGLEMQQNKVKKANRYLKYQSVRIDKMIKKGNYAGAAIIWCILAKNSLSYQVSLYNKVKREWYWKSNRFEMFEELMQVVNHMRTWNLRTLVNRFYIEKKNGKMRPIGSPNIQGKVLHRWVADMIKHIVEPQRSERANHGFRNNRGIGTAIREVVENYEKDTSQTIYEYDLKSFFNNVPWPWIQHYLKTHISKEISNLVISILKNTRYRFDKLMEEKELRIVEEGKSEKKKKRKPLIYRNGTTQGSPLSPIIATLVLEMHPFPTGLTMYADDGIYIGKDLDPVKEWLTELQVMGIEIEESKSRVVEEEVKYLGININFREGVLYHEDLGTYMWKTFGTKGIEEWIAKGRGLYSNPVAEKKKWEWQIAEGSQAEYCNKSIIDEPKNWIITHSKGFFKLEHKGYKWIDGKGVFEFTKTSSEAMIWLFTIASQAKSLQIRRRIKPLKFPNWEDTKWKPMSKKDYYEINPTTDVEVQEMPDGTRAVFGMPKAAAMLDQNYDFVGSWRRNIAALKEMGINVPQKVMPIADMD